jgi:hypothetical protein
MVVAVGRPDEGEALALPTGARAILIRSVAAQLRGEIALSLQLAADAQGLLDARLGAVLDRVLTAFSLAGVALALDDRSPLASLRLADISLESLPAGYLSAYTMARGVDELLAGRLSHARDAFAEREPDLFTSWRLVCLLAETELALGDGSLRWAAMRLAFLGRRVGAAVRSDRGSGAGRVRLGDGCERRARRRSSGARHSGRVRPRAGGGRPAGADRVDAGRQRS